MMNQRFCIVTETYKPEINGVANTLGYWVEGMQGRGISVQIVRPKQSPEDKRSKSALEENIPVYGLAIPAYAELKFGLPCKRKLRKLWSKNKPDAIYVATEGPLGFSALRVAKELNIPVLSGFHTNFQAYCKYYRLGWFESIIFRYMRYFHNQTKGTLVPTQKQKDWLLEQHFKNVTVLRRGIDFELFSPDKRSSALRSSWGVYADEQPVCLYVGRIAAEKNIALLGTAYESLKLTHPTTRFVFVGDGPMRKQMERDYPDIIFAGMKTGEQLARYYASADIFMFPSRTDTFGNVVTEAMASRLGIVSFNDAAAKELLVNNKSAFIADINSDQDYIDQLHAALNDPEKLAQLREAAYQIAAKLSWDEIVDQFIQQLLKKQTDSSEGSTYANAERITSSL
ncbi:MAG: glycosyltransferase involved in cell wall biosynthesis [Oleiphilaceae bacterium]|jgi:glycosyltransferase involved in cell wall biosynthesis